MSVRMKALIFLLLAILLWSGMGIVGRVIVPGSSSIKILFSRMIFAAVPFLPLFILKRPWRKKGFNRLVLISLLSTVNVVFFMIGIAYTSASASQIIYAFIPILILLFGWVIQKKTVSLGKTAGVLVGFVGIGLIGYFSAVEKGSTMSGNIVGNLIIGIAMIGWTGYILASKKISVTFDPVERGATSVLTTFVVSCVIYLVLLRNDPRMVSFSAAEIAGSFYMGTIGTFVTYILYQNSIQTLSPLMISLVSYIQPILTALLAALLLSEKATSGFILGSSLVFAGLFLATSGQLYRKILRSV